MGLGVQCELPLRRGAGLAQAYTWPTSTGPAATHSLSLITRLPAECPADIEMDMRPRGAGKWTRSQEQHQGEVKGATAGNGEGHECPDTRRC